MEQETIEKYSDLAIEQVITHGPKIILAIITLFIGLKLIKALVNFLSNRMEAKDFDQTLRPFIIGFTSLVLKVLLFVSVASMIGIETTSFIAVLGAAGLAVGLALQGSLSNFAGGVLILVFKPFKLGHIIEAQGSLGSVEKIDILHTHVKTFDNRVVIMPNGALANSNITNLSLKDIRRAELSVGVAYGTDLQKTREVIIETLKKDERVLEDPEPVVRFINFGDSSLDLTVRCWTKSDDLWPVYWDNMEAINNALNANDIEIPFPQRDLHMRTK